MAPKTAKSLIALFGVTGLLAVGMLATNLLVDEQPATGAASTVAAMVSPGPSGSAGDAEAFSSADSGSATAKATSTRQCTLLSPDQIAGVTGGRVGYAPDPAVFTGDICWWQVTGSEELPDGTRLSLSEDGTMTTEKFASYVEEEIASAGARNLKGLGEQAIVNGDGGVEVLSGDSAYVLDFTAEAVTEAGAELPPAGQLRTMEVDLLKLFVPSSRK